ncbi:MAG: DNA-directed RNA polymerase subunit alpha [Candidatus Wildermuthbacteria bacterium]|nr:DNA-directed RNA polymerase subunit alpha [Candidatus Wildermuthbacteria bacterium]
MSFLSKPTAILEKQGNKAVFTVEELYPGYGITVGNSLRRVLLSSLGGAAATRVHIKGISHEFTAIPGVMEDAVMLLLNLKQLRFAMIGDEPQKAILSVKGEKEVKASDFKLPSQLKIMNKDLHIATLTSKTAELEMEIEVERGIGYVPSQKLTREREEIGTVVLDAIFTPIRNVNFRVDHMRVGERTDFDKLTLTIETDGTMSPEQALFQSAEILRKEFEVIAQGVQASGMQEKEADEEEAEPKKEKPAKEKKAAKKKK